LFGAILSLTTIGSLMLLAITSLARKRIFQNLPLVGLCLLVFFLDNLIHLLVNNEPGLQVIPNGSYRNTVTLVWSAKLYSTLICMALVFLLRPVLPPDSIGFTLRQKSGSFLPCCVAMVIAGCVSASLELRSAQSPLDFTVLLYMAVMPGLNEELVYRGLLLGLLNKILPQKRLVLGAPVGWGALITAILFGLLHGFWVEADWSLHINWYPVLFSCLTGMLLAWLRERSGSLLFPFLTHGVIDFSIFLARMT
jgi:membrane protease YdiL (CAAX protease family)